MHKYVQIFNKKQFSTTNIILMSIPAEKHQNMPIVQNAQKIIQKQRNAKRNLCIFYSKNYQTYNLHNVI